MIVTNGDPLIPASLVADGMQRANAQVRVSGRAQFSASGPSTPVRARARCAQEAALRLALVALDTAREQLDRYARLTDEPKPGSVDAADLLDAARIALVTP